MTSTSLLRRRLGGGTPVMRLLALALAVSISAPAMTAPDAAAIHARVVPLDTHIDIDVDFDGAPGAALQDGTGQFDLAKAARGGLKAAVLAVYAPQEAESPEALARAEEIAETKHRIIVGLASRYPDRVGFARTPADVRSIVGSGKLAIIAGIVNGGAFVDELDDIDAWAEKGVAMFGLVHAGHNRLADSSRPALPRGERVARSGGLSSLGKDAVVRLNRLGLLIDVSQLSDAAFADVLAISKSPVIASHSDVRGLVDVGRNVSDAQLDALKANGGVIALNAFSLYLRGHDAQIQTQFDALKKEFGLSDAGNPPLSAERANEYRKRYYALRGTEPRADVARFIDAVDYVVKRIGVDHVALSSDFNHGGGVIGWNNVAETGNVTAELLRRGYSEADIAKIWSGNVLRIWQVARDRASQLRAASTAAPGKSR